MPESRMHWSPLFLLSVGMALAGVCVAEAEDVFAAVDVEFFEKQIRPLLIEHCLECHGDKKQEGGLSLISRERVLRGGDTGAALVIGKPDESRIIKAIEYLDDPKMPPDGKLPQVSIDRLRQWVTRGAAWPAASTPADAPPAGGTRGFQVTAKQKQWWSFRPVRDWRPPEVKQTQWPLNDIDRFILAGLESQDVSPATVADRAVWLRRATFDLTGLPPTPDEVEAFVTDSSDRAYARVVDRLLESPAYGQRWARHWLDVARYADFYDANPATRTASCEITEAWRYRDWVVDAFNADLPFDQFIVHQIAGDLLPSPTGEEIYPEGLIATTFLSNGVWDRGDADKEKIVSDMADDNIDVIGKAFLGLTLGCARCHDHKFDPVSTEDYYALAGMFYSSHILKELGTKGGEYTMNRVPLIGPAALAKRAQQEQQLAAVNARLAELDRRQRFQELTAGGKSLVPTEFKSEAGAVATVTDDASLSVTGTLAKDVYTLQCVVPDSTDVRYLRLEAISDPALPAQGPGRADDGNFVISRFAATFTPPVADAAPVPIKFHSAKADFEQLGFPVASILDDDLKDGWAIAPLFGQSHVAAFEIAPEIKILAGSRMTVTIEHRHADKHALGKFRLSVTDTLAFQPPRETPERKELVTQRDGLQQHLSSPVAVAIAVTEGGTPGGLFPGVQDVPIHIRGSYAKLGPVVPRRLPRFFAGEKQAPITSGSGRPVLAAWVASRENPLTARVIVNRVWQWHFGEGLVRTPSNFGLLSEPPSHPELLDWLATRFVEDGWSLKKLHRRIMLSATYRQSSRTSRESFDRDPENRWLGRFSGRRLEAEAIRDAMLAVSGQLDLAAGGPAGDDFTIRRRSLYVQTARWQRDSYANLFDAANPDSSTEKRITSTVAPQALLLLNHPLTQDLARLLAERLIREVPHDDSARIQRAYRLLFCRLPNDDELAVARQVVSGGDPAVANSAWVDLAHVLLCCNEFVYLD